MRITGGQARSISISCPKGDWVRPATDKMRESVFSSLGSDIEGSLFLDLFAGAGSYGLEAISRGARAGVFVEQHRAAVKSITGNLKLVQKSVGHAETNSSYSIESADVFKWLERKTVSQGFSGYDIVFVDPPYREVDAAFTTILNALIPLLNPKTGAWIFFESPMERDGFPQGYALRKVFGKGREDARGMLLSWLPNR